MKLLHKAKTVMAETGRTFQTCELNSSWMLLECNQVEHAIHASSVFPACFWKAMVIVSDNCLVHNTCLKHAEKLLSFISSESFEPLDYCYYHIM